MMTIVMIRLIATLITITTATNITLRITIINSAINDNIKDYTDHTIIGSSSPCGASTHNQKSASFATLVVISEEHQR